MLNNKKQVVQLPFLFFLTKSIESCVHFALAACTVTNYHEYVIFMNPQSKYAEHMMYIYTSSGRHANGPKIRTT